MPGANRYDGAREVVMQKETQEAFEKGFAKLHDTIKSFGLNPEGLKFSAAEYLLMISAEEQRSGAWHIYANDGKSFYDVAVSAPGSMFEMASMPKNVAEGTPQQQALYLAFDIGMNLMANMRKFLSVDDDKIHGGGSMEFDPGLKYTSCMRMDPAVYLASLDQVLQWRLENLGLKRVSSVPVKKSSGPTL